VKKGQFLARSTIRPLARPKIESTGNIAHLAHRTLAQLFLEYNTLGRRMRSLPQNGAGTGYPVVWIAAFGPAPRRATAGSSGGPTRNSAPESCTRLLWRLCTVPRSLSREETPETMRRSDGPTLIYSGSDRQPFIASLMKIFTCAHAKEYPRVLRASCQYSITFRGGSECRVTAPRR